MDSTSSGGGQRMLLSLLLMVIVSGTHGQPSNAITLDLEAETGLGFRPGNVHWRSRATGPTGVGVGQSVWLERDGDMVSFAICMPRGEEVRVQHVIYSSDGWPKQGVVRIDRQVVGTFKTEDTSNYGHSWNDFHVAPGPFRSVVLSEGPHIIDVILQQSMDNDPWGLEIDKLVLWFGSHFTLDQLQCPETQGELISIGI